MILADNSEGLSKNSVGRLRLFFTQIWKFLNSEWNKYFRGEGEFFC